MAMAGVLFLTADVQTMPGPGSPNVIDGPYASLLHASADLGPARSGPVQLTATLQGRSRPVRLMEWAGLRNLSVRWQPAHDWAILEGAPNQVADAFGVTINEYRGRRGQLFYASPQQPTIPAPLHGEVAEIGRILGYTPHRESRPTIMAPLDVPDRGLTPDALRTAYNANQLAAEGYTGKGTTVVIFAFSGYDQADLDAYATTYRLPKFTPVLVGGQPSEPRAETTMDLQLVHAIAPDAQKVVVNARPTVEGDGGFERIGQLLATTDRQFPGAVWSFSIGWGCDKLYTAADLAPVRSALAAAHVNGTTSFSASGDLAGLECKGGQDWSSPPSTDDIGLDAVASLPEITSVGGTTLSTGADGRWLAEQAWFHIPLSQGSGGGVSSLFERPDWQRTVSPEEHAANRLVPDVSAVADPFTSVRIVLHQRNLVGGGTSQSAPIWAGLTAVMNQYLLVNGGRAIGNINPLLYRIAADSPLPAFRDVTLGGNAAHDAGPGYDLVTGLGTPDVEKLVQDVLLVQKLTQ
ncbi:peptidase S53 [Mycobacterium sp. DBP42]|nr:peptidase S53 [Mycobacterium sp. DBP42]